MRVISGTLKGRNILGYNIEGTRPTMDRVKESIFAMLGDKIKGSVVLDLFAGTGNYGIEAISNGTSQVYFNDKNIKCVEIIKKNLENFNCLDKAKILNLDYLKCLNYLNKENIKFDLVFLDPPYKDKCLEEIILFMINNKLLNNNSLIVVEFSNDDLKDSYNNLKLIKTRSYGEKNVYIYKYKGEL